MWCLEVWNEYLCSGAEDTTIRVWNENGDCVNILKGHINSVYCITVWNNHLCSGSADRSVRIWNKKMECIDVLEEHEDMVTSLRVWNNNLFSGDYSGRILIWNWVDKKCISILNPHTDEVRSMIVWKNTLCSASRDSTITLWIALIWKPSTHSLFPSSARQQVVTVLMIAAKKQDGTPIHPESHLHMLPKDILFEILSFAILF
jgi:WD40 repeat protein